MVGAHILFHIFCLKAIFIPKKAKDLILNGVHIPLRDPYPRRKAKEIRDIRPSMKGKRYSLLIANSLVFVPLRDECFFFYAMLRRWDGIKCECGMLFHALGGMG